MSADLPADAPIFRTPRSTFTMALIGSVGCWLAFPPVGWSLLVWIAPVPWLWLVGFEKLPGGRPYRVIWLAGTLFWLLTVHWIRLPHPLNYLGWIALAGYLGGYLPAFVALSRVGVHRCKLPLWLVAPIVWTGLDWVRGHLMTGFLMGSLAHTQVGFPRVIQIANVLGEYGVTFLILLTAACVTHALFAKGWRRPLHLLPALLSILVTLAYGSLPFSHLSSYVDSLPPHTELRVLLVQGNTLADWKNDETKQQQIMEEYARLSREGVEKARRRGEKVDLVIWPETSFRQTLVTLEPGYEPPSDQFHASHLEAAKQQFRRLVSQLGCAILVGVDRVHVLPDEKGQPDFASYNSSILVDKHGKSIDIYDKMHRVPFGEFIPLSDWIPSLYRLTPLTGGIRAGASPTAMELDEVVCSVNICYESAVPHLVRRHVMELADQGKTPDLLVNLTNDAWFWGSSELDMHLACSTFRAVEMRTPMLIAANGGLSAEIDDRGRVLQITERQQPQTLLAQPLLTAKEHRKGYPSVYAARGDWFAIGCMICCMVLASIGWWSPSRTPRP